MHVSGNSFNTPIQQIAKTDSPKARVETTPFIRDNAEKKSRMQAKSAGSPVSDKTQAALLELQEVKKSGSELTLDKGKEKPDSYLDEFFSNTFKTSGKRLLSELPPLLLPNAKNIASISEHASMRFKNLLEQYNIQSAPSQITFDQEGRMQIPSDYPHAEKLKQLFTENPGFERELRTLNALSSHYAEIQKRVPFHKEFASATTQTQADAIIAKYSHLFQDNGNYARITLTFSDLGEIDVKADGKSIPLKT